MPPVEDLIAKRWSMKRDATTFNMIVRRYSGWVHATSKRILGNAADADEVTQECFEALVRLEEMPEPYLGAWLHRVATNQSLKRLRGDRRRQNRETAYATEAQECAPEPRWEDLAGHIDEAVAQLPEELRGPLVAHFMEGRSHVHIAQALGLPRTTVTSRISRGVESLREYFRRRGVTATSAALTALLTSKWSQAARISPTLNARLLRLSIEQARRKFAPRVSAYTEELSDRKIVMNKMIMAVFILGLAFLGPWIVTKMPKHHAQTPAAAATQSEDEQGTPSQPVPGTPAEVSETVAPVTVESPSAPAVGTASKQPTGAIKGSVRYAGKVVSGLKIRIEYIGKTFAEFETQTDATGAFELTGLPPGKSRLTFYPPWHDDNVDKLAVIEAGKVTVLDFATEYNAAISGRVTFQDQPVSNAFVNISIVAQDSSIQEFHVKSDADGRFEFAQVPAGTAIVKVVEGGENDWHATIRTAQTTPRQTTLLDIELPAERGGILCEIGVPENCQPFMQVVLWGAFEMTSLDAETFHRVSAFKVADPPVSGDGYMRVTGLEPGTYTILAAASEPHGREDGGKQALIANARVATTVVQVVENEDTPVELAIR